MNVNVQINLAEGEEPPGMTPSEILLALGGDPEKDSCGLSISAGHSPPPPPPPELPAVVLPAPPVEAQPVDA